MITPNRVLVLVILVLIVVVSAWSRLRHIDASDHEPQRIRIEDHPAFRAPPAAASPAPETTVAARSPRP